jgi:hypothetical protein
VPRSPRLHGTGYKIRHELPASSSVDRCTGANIPPEAASKNNRCKGVTIVPGAPFDQSAYRSAVAGLFGIATMIRELCGFHDITAGTVYLGCDGLSALLHNCADIDCVVKPTSPHFDLITATRVMLQQCITYSGIKTTTPTLSLTAGRLSILRWMKTLKCIGPKQLINLASVILQSPENLWQFSCRTKRSV